jgi:hypothetical protein
MTLILADSAMPLLVRSGLSAGIWKPCELDTTCFGAALASIGRDALADADDDE